MQRELVQWLTSLTQPQRSYVLGVIGSSLLRDWHEGGEGQAARLSELAAVVRLLDDAGSSPDAPPVEVSADIGYSEWAATYDDRPNPMTQAEESWVRSILAPRTASGALVLDAACGTGRHTAWLTAEGFQTIGVDRNTAMLRRAADRTPRASFIQGDLRALPILSGSVAAAVCSLALCHLPELVPALLELARVLQPGGRLVISDPHGRAAYAGGQGFYGAGGVARPRYIRNHYRQASEWIQAFDESGFVVESCQEPRMDETSAGAHPVAPYFPDSTLAAFRGVPYLWIWSVVLRDD